MNYLIGKIGLMLRGSFAFLGAVIFPLLIIMLWLLRNHQLPVNDAANYLMTMADIYHYVGEHGILGGIIHSFFIRGWRPIAFPNLSIPFLLITGGNLYVTYCLTSMLCAFISLIYIYLYFRLQLDRLAAFIATNTIGLLPLIFAQIVMFYAESALFFCLLGSLYHLARSDFFRNKRQSIAFCILFSLGIIIRPVEAITHLFLVLIVFLISGYMKSAFKFKQLILIFLLLSMALSVLFGKTFFSALHVLPLHLMDNGGFLDAKMTDILMRCLIASVIGVLLSVTVLMICSFNKLHMVIRWYLETDKSYLVPVFLFSIFVVTLWYLPFSFETYEWIYRTSLGDVANNTGALTGSGFSSDVLYKYLEAEGLLVVGVTLTVAILSLFLTARQALMAIILSPTLIYLLLTLPFPMWESFYTVQIVTRKLSFAFPALLMALLFVGMRSGLFQRVRVALLALLAAAQFGLLLILIFKADYTVRIPAIEKTIGYFIPAPVLITPNPHDVVDQFLLQEFGKYHFKNIAFELNPGTPDARHFIESEPIDPFLQSTMTVAYNRPYMSAYPYMNMDSPANISMLKQRFDAVLLFDREDRMQISNKSVTEYKILYSNERSPSLRLYYSILALYSGRELNRYGFITAKCITVKSKNGLNYKACLLLTRLDGSMDKAQ